MTAHFLFVCAVIAVALICLAKAKDEEQLRSRSTDTVKSDSIAGVDDHEHLDLVQSSNLPPSFDWRNKNGTNYCSAVSMQFNTPLCGSCWAFAATGALSDRYAIATQGLLRIALAPQQLLNFYTNLTGGSCMGGNVVKAYGFIHSYGISDETCAPYVGHGLARGIKVAGMTEIEAVRAHQCSVCSLDGSCHFATRDSYDLYGADDYGVVIGEQAMMSEIYARGPIACRLFSNYPIFDNYRGGILNCVDSPWLCRTRRPDHNVIITGWGVDKVSNMSYWVGRNTFGTQWGEGVGGGWFRLQRGVGALGVDKNACAWAVPAAADVKRAMQQYEDSR